MGAVTHVLVNDPTRGYGIFGESQTLRKISGRTYEIIARISCTTDDNNEYVGFKEIAGNRSKVISNSGELKHAPFEVAWT